MFQSTVRHKFPDIPGRWELVVISLIELQLLTFETHSDKRTFPSMIKLNSSHSKVFHTPLHVSSCYFCVTSQNSVSTKHLLMTASGLILMS